MALLPHVCSLIVRLLSEQKHLTDKLPGGGTDQGESSTKMVHAQKIEPLTIAELNNFVLTGDPQIIEFLCTAKVTGVQEDEGWCYIGCSVCSKNTHARRIFIHMCPMQPNQCCG
ncbi:hypothetical protein YC2023_017583 [Brassica napus]